MLLKNVTTPVSVSVLGKAVPIPIWDGMGWLQSYQDPLKNSLAAPSNKTILLEKQRLGQALLLFLLQRGVVPGHHIPVFSCMRLQQPRSKLRNLWKQHPVRQEHVRCLMHRGTGKVLDLTFLCPSSLLARTRMLPVLCCFKNGLITALAGQSQKAGPKLCRYSEHCFFITVLFDHI